MAQLPPTPLEERYKDNGSLQHSCQNRLQSGVLHPKKNTHSTWILMVSFLWWAILTYFHQILKLENFLPQGEIYHRFFHFDTRCGPTSSKDLRSFLRWSSLTRQKKIWSAFGRSGEVGACVDIPKQKWRWCHKLWCYLCTNYKENIRPCSSFYMYHKALILL